MTEKGRPSELTPQVREKLVQALAIGNYRGDAARFAGIDPTTLSRWMRRGREEPQGPFAELRDAVLDAEAKAKVMALGCVTKAIRDGDWKAAAWYLERKHPHQYAEKSHLFLVAKALEQMEEAAEEAGSPLPEGAWEKAWAAVAKEFSLKLPHANGKAQTDAEGFQSPDDLDTALRLLGVAPDAPR